MSPIFIQEFRKNKTDDSKLSSKYNNSGEKASPKNLKGIKKNTLEDNNAQKELSSLEKEKISISETQSKEYNNSSVYEQQSSKNKKVHGSIFRHNELPDNGKMITFIIIDAYTILGI